ncbi:MULTISPECIES: MSMEG_0569 family flavin-dependent oxidoreductase [unclassified Gordonia (in: high G+C Gram-positive bacteria)]|uniref:MSMEG_0569 family flavin-dependent oxidoreductase n=1 Tax=unclassified Gordonia (in: high G+C Gram-positive bacteria) TaxID=2657482 RepID=UPI001F0FDFE2|nr:MSMEG_0569 family flavin-dependent oxidoreductase [Gordonia sp. ABSL49_1]MCH5641154.1 MSMEG_0569 family flavin-dependent oxidoreductase [Gordonia sp. ABSL49_1]
MSESAHTPTHHVPVVIIGGGQAGLSVSWYLGRAGIEHLVVESQTPMHAWSDKRWDNFTLVTPNWHCRLPGYTYSGTDPDGFMTRDEVIEWLDGWLATFEPPMRTHTSVTRLRQPGSDAFELTMTGPTGEQVLTCDQVVVATGGYPIPVIPPYAASLNPAVTQIHSEQYRNADQLPDGAVLVVGTGQSGAQIAEDLHLAGREVHLAVGNAPRVARTYRGRDCMTWLSDMGLYDIAAQQYPGGKAAQEKTNHYVTGRDGGRDIDLRRFALEGMHLYGHLAGGKDSALQFAPTLTDSLDKADTVYNSICVDIDRYIDDNCIEAPEPGRYQPVWQPDSEPTELDLDTAGITAIVWAIGYRPDYRWIEASAFDGAGRPMQTRGATQIRGLSFVGLPWMHTWGSGRFLGIDRDARHVAESIGAALGRPELRLASGQ